jgi:hypothetical protein
LNLITPFDKSTDIGKFISLNELADKLEALRKSLIASDAPQNRRKLREQGQKPGKEAWHAILFARAYECYFRLTGMSVRIEPQECSAHDATLQWIENDLTQELKVQLKELPPESLNADISLPELLAKSIEKYPPSPDITMAVFICRTHPGYQIEIPKHGFAGLWTFGFTGIGKPEFIFLVGKDGRGEHSNCKKFLTEVTT